MKTSYLFAGGLVVVFLILGGMYALKSQKTETAYPTVETTQEATTTTTTATGTTSVPTKTAGTYTMADVSSHSNASSCWTIISGTVYDLTKWIGAHPGGERAILSICGKDGTAAFEGQHGGQGRPEQMLATFKIGVLGS